MRSVSYRRHHHRLFLPTNETGDTRICLSLFVMYPIDGDLMSLEQITRRGVLRGTAVGLAGLSLAGTASARSDRLSEELNAVRAATRKYRDVGLARTDGYVIFSPYVPEMGFHAINPGLIAPDEHTEVDITKPPILVYYTTGNYRPGPGTLHDPDRDGDLRLGAVEYAHLGDHGAAADYFSDEDVSRNLHVTEEEGWEYVPTAGITALHAWVHRGNPAGVFHPTNPTVA